MGFTMNNKDIQKRRIMRYFIDSAREIMDEKGMGAVTLREVASRAGYNSATLYNYFNNLDHLLFYMALGHLKDYTADLKLYIDDCKNSADEYASIWRCFCKYSFKKPKVYHAIFFGEYSYSLNNDLERYYQIFPEELEGTEKSLHYMLTGNALTERNMSLVQNMVSEEIIHADDAQAVNEMTCFLYRGLLESILDGHIQCSSEDACRKMDDYVGCVIKTYTAVRDA